MSVKENLLILLRTRSEVKENYGYCLIRVGIIWEILILLNRLPNYLMTWFRGGGEGC